MQLVQAPVHPIGVTELCTSENGGAQQRPKGHSPQPPDRQTQPTGRACTDQIPQPPLPLFQESGDHQCHICPQEPVRKIHAHNLLDSPVMTQGDLQILQPPVIRGGLLNVGLGIGGTGKDADRGHVLRLCLHLLQSGGKTQEIFHLLLEQAIAHPVGKAPVRTLQNAR